MAEAAGGLRVVSLDAEWEGVKLRRGPIEILIGTGDGCGDLLVAGALLHVAEPEIDAAAAGRVIEQLLIEVANQPLAVFVAVEQDVGDLAARDAA